MTREGFIEHVGRNGRGRRCGRKAASAIGCLAVVIDLVQGQFKKSSKGNKNDWAKLPIT